MFVTRSYLLLAARDQRISYLASTSLLLSGFVGVVLGGKTGGTLISRFQRSLRHGETQTAVDGNLRLPNLPALRQSKSDPVLVLGVHAGWLRKEEMRIRGLHAAHAQQRPLQRPHALRPLL